MQYEILYLIGEPKTAEIETISKTIETHITECGATMLDEKWEDRRKLAYPIKHITRGTFIARRFELPEGITGIGKEDPIEAMRKHFRLMDDVLRLIIVRSEGLPSLKEFASRKDEEKIRHAQGPRHGEDKKTKRVERKPLSSMPFAPKKEAPQEKPVSKEEKAPVVKADTPEKKETPKKEAKKEAPRDTKEIDEKLDEILNM